MNGMENIRVLIVDDMAQVRGDLRTVLTLAGSTAGAPIDIVGEAQDGEEALRQMDILRPDVVLMDLEMPVMDGYTAAFKMKEANPNIHIIALSVHSYASARAKACQAGIDQFIEKGVPVAEMIRAILDYKETTSRPDTRHLVNTKKAGRASSSKIKC
jgi:DNA-binding NarL/FixJ family response regulator